MRSVPLLSLLFAACQSTALPPGHGEGLTAVDRQPPAGATTWERPQWNGGDRFVYVRGKQVTTAFRVREATADGYLLVDERSGMQRSLSPDLAFRRLDFPDDPEAVRVHDPEDAELSWPLWVGKRWTVHYLRKAPGAAMPVRADYHCDAQETLVTPAGTFDCLRIWRRAQPLLPGRTFMENVEVLWYAPQVGWFARRLENSVVQELQEFHRQ